MSGAFKMIANQAFLMSADNTRSFYHSGGAYTFANNAVVSAQIADSGAYLIGANQILGARKTGWSTATGTATRTTFATGSVTLPQLAERVKALIDDLEATAGHGLLGA